MNTRLPDRSTPRTRLLFAADHQPRGRRVLLLEVATRVVYPTVSVLGLYLVLAAHYRPGGGFVAGLVIGLGLALRRLAGGPHELGVASLLPPGTLLGVGLTMASGYAVAGVFLSGDLLAGHSWKVSLGALGHLSVGSSLIFEVGVVAIVLGLVLDVLRTLGAGDAAVSDADEQAGEEER